MFSPLSRVVSLLTPPRRLGLSHSSRSLVALMALAVVGTSFSGLPLLFSTPQAEASQVPSGPRSWILGKDTSARFRFDGLITLSNGVQYLPVYPSDAEKMKETTNKVIFEDPKDAELPDIVEFANHVFLLRMVPLTNGKITLPIRKEYPIELKEGLLPQDLLVPGNFIVPSELKVLLGAIPYPPPQNAPAIGIPGTSPDTAVPDAVKRATSAPQQLYVADLTEQALVAFHPETLNRQWKIPLNCLPSGLASDPEGANLYVSCLTTNEVLLVDTRANLVKARIKVGKRPVSVRYLTEQGKVIVSNRFDNFLSLIDPTNWRESKPLEIPGPSEVLLEVPGSHWLYAANSGSDEIYEIDLNSWKHRRTLKGPKRISAMAFTLIKPSNTGSTTEKKWLWMASRQEHVVSVMDLESGEIIKTFSNIRKPTALTVGGTGQVFVLSSEGDEIHIIDAATLEALPVVGLPEGSFPREIVASSDGRRAYIGNAGSNLIHVVNLEQRMVERTIPIEGRGVELTLQTQSSKDIEGIPPYVISTGGARADRYENLINPPAVERQRRREELLKDLPAWPEHLGGNRPIDADEPKAERPISPDTPRVTFTQSATPKNPKKSAKKSKRDGKGEKKTGPETQPDAKAKEEPSLSQVEAEHTTTVETNTTVDEVNEAHATPIKPSSGPVPMELSPYDPFPPGDEDSDSDDSN